MSSTVPVRLRDVRGYHRFERVQLVLAGLDDPVARLRHLVPDARQIAEWLGDDQPRLLIEEGEARVVGIELLERLVRA
jgi:hypothetical protein